MKNKARKAKMRKKTKHWNVKNPHTWCGFFSGPFFTIKLGKNWNSDLFLAYWLRLGPYIYAVELKTGPRFFSILKCFLGMCTITDSVNWGSKFDPHPQPQISLVRIFCLQPGLGWKFLLRRTCCRSKNGSHCSFQDFHSLTKENQVSLVRTFLSDPGSGSKIRRLGGWGWKNDPDLSGPVRDTPPYRAIPFRDSIAEGGIAPICLVFIGYRAGIAEIPLLRGVSHLHFACSPMGKRSEKGGGGIAPNWPCWDTKNP